MVAACISRAATWTCALDSSRAERLERAKGYPYKRPSSSYVLVRQTPYCFQDSAWGGLKGFHGLELTRPDGKDQAASMADVLAQEGVLWSADGVRWTPVLAVGSNAGVSQLCRKYPPELFPGGVVIPVVRAVLEDFDVTYAPIVTSYGSVAATLGHSPGTAVELFVTFLDTEELEHMHRTEGAYDLVQLSGVKLHLGTCKEKYMKGLPAAACMDSVMTYVHQQGSLTLSCDDNNGHAQLTPVALAEINASKRQFPELTQVQMQCALQYGLGASSADESPLETLPHWPSDARQGGKQRARDTEDSKTVGYEDSSDLDDWIERNLSDESIRQSHIVRLGRTAVPFDFTGAEVMQSIGDAFSKNVK